MEKSNVLIAEFMELPVIVSKPIGRVKFARVNFVRGDEDWYESEELIYNLSWDWLMPVIVKIADIKGATHHTLYGSIDIAYKEVVSFINQFNKEKQNG